ncbi:hypothetical protein [Zooshikella ganghwensis]|uniref:hypothetical protein n=1 Tax=Zooshikella ganghwensis TaxID=202772 RepID=UPI000481B2FD|nr:hypothetical protein [Zooshikella ganghwensis]
MESKCVNCHFLAKDNIHIQQSLKPHEREHVKNGDYSSIISKGPLSLYCAKGVWDERIDSSLVNVRDKNICKIKRSKNKCFYIPYSPGMTRDAAEELLKHERENDKIKVENSYKRAALLLILPNWFKNIFGL